MLQEMCWVTSYENSTTWIWIMQKIATIIYARKKSSFLTWSSCFSPSVENITAQHFSYRDFSCGKRP
jgi:hypothetical protein